MSTGFQNSAATVSFPVDLRQELSARVPPAEKLRIWLEAACGEAVFGATILVEDH